MTVLSLLKSADLTLNAHGDQIGQDLFIQKHFAEDDYTLTPFL